MAELSEKDRLARINLDHVLDKHPKEIQVIEVKPRNLDDLKAWVGIPNGHAAAKHRVGLARTVNQEHLPKRGFNYEDLEPHQQKAVYDQAHNLLFGEVDDEMLSDPAVSAVVDHIMRTATPLPMTVGGDLSVADGQVYRLTTPSASFNTITIHGTGTIQLTQDTKVTCNSLIYQAS